MSGVQDVVAALRDLARTDQVDVDETGARPFEWEAAELGTLYAFPTGRLTEVPFETGPSVRQDFEVDLVLTARADESATRQRDPEVSSYLDEWRAAITDVVRRNRATELWHHIQAAETSPPRTLSTRSVAIRVAGYRLIGGIA